MSTTITAEQITTGVLSAVRLGVGSGLDVVGTDLVATGVGGSGTVTSVDVTVPAFLGISGGPITTSGTLAITVNAQSGNKVLASPSGGGSGTPDFRALVAADIPAIAESGVTGLVSDLSTLSSAVAGKEPAISAGTSAQYWRGDKAFATLNQAAVAGLTTADSPTFAGLTIGTLTGILKAASGVVSVATANTDYLTPSFAGTTSIVTLGTVGTGVWHGTIVGLAYGGTAADLSATGGAGQVLRQSSSGAAVTVSALGTSDIAGLSPGSHSFGVGGTPGLNDTTPPIYLDRACTCDGLTIAAGTAPSGGSLTVQIEKSTDGASWSNLTSGAVSATTGNYSGTAACTTAVSANTYLRGKFTAVNGAADATVVLFIRS